MYNTKSVRVRFDQWADAEPPHTLLGDTEIWSFNPRHACFKHPLAVGLDRDGYAGPTLEIQNKLRAGTAVILSAYEHGNIVWSRYNPGQPFCFDTAPVAGILLTKPCKGETREQREKRIDMMIDEWNAWCNGDVWSIEELDADDEIIESYTVYGYKNALEFAERIRTLCGLETPVQFSDAA